MTVRGDGFSPHFIGRPHVFRLCDPVKPLPPPVRDKTPQGSPVVSPLRDTLWLADHGRVAADLRAGSRRSPPRSRPHCPELENPDLGTCAKACRKEGIFGIALDKSRA